MPDVLNSLFNRDIGFIRLCASFWGVELKAVNRDEAARELAGLMLNPEAMGEVVNSLPIEAKQALQALIQASGRITWANFTRQWGELRLAGPGRRDREEVYLNPVSATEVLTYRSLLANAFFDTSSGLQEFAFIPDDLFPILEKLLPINEQMPQELVLSVPPGRPAASRECVHIFPASDKLLDDAVTLLAALRLDMDPAGMSLPVNVVVDFLRSAGILQGNDPFPDRVKAFLEMSPTRALALLSDSWQESESFNELRQLPGLLFEGEWRNQPLSTRNHLLQLVDSIPVNHWWSLTALVAYIKEKLPDFQRPAGEYDSWFIKRAADASYLRGFASWDEVDGALVRYLVTGPLFWLNRVDLARAEEGGEITAFRRRENPPARQETARLTVSSNGLLTLPRLVPRSVRYQVARFSEWQPPRVDDYRYVVTIASLQRAARQGLKINQLLTLLAKHAATELPPVFVTALKRWESHGTQARLERRELLRLGSPEILEEVRKSKAGRFLGEVIGPTTIIIKPGAREKVMASLASLGFLAEVDSQQ